MIPGVSRAPRDRYKENLTIYDLAEYADDLIVLL